MYKITLYDYNNVAFVSGVTAFFTDNIDVFQREWFKLDSDEERKQRFLESRNGKIVTDYYSDEEELNIVQEDKNAKILFKRFYEYFYPKSFTLSNAWNWTSVILVHNAKFWVRGIRFKDKYYLVGKYKLKGVCELECCLGGSAGIGLGRRAVYGNCVLRTKYKSVYAFDKGEALYDVTDLHNFENDTIESICYLPMREFDTKEELKYFVEEAPIEGLFEELMRDIPGEAG